MLIVYILLTVIAFILSYMADKLHSIHFILEKTILKKQILEEADEDYDYEISKVVNQVKAERNKSS